MAGRFLWPFGFSACWVGGAGTDAVDDPHSARCGPEPACPVSLFGQGVVTFHIQGLFRTPPGCNLWVGGSPNRPKDGIYPLTGIVETDWAPYTFTMNWKFTRPNHWVRFEAGEPICFVFPVQRGHLEAITPKLVPMTDAPDVMRQFNEWSRSRNAFHEQILAAETPQSGADKWQKDYYRGVDADSRAATPDHQTKLRLRTVRIASAEMR